MTPRQLCAVAVVVAATTWSGCGKGTPPPPPPAPPPVAPATPPPAPAPEAPDVAPQADEYARIKALGSDEIERMGLLSDIHFDYDEYTLREGDREVLNRNGEALKKFDFIKITIQGHCDERGSVEYNLALGERRARVAYDYLLSLGVPADRMKTVSYGKEIPLCTDANEECWARNRRDHFEVSGKVQ